MLLKNLQKASKSFERLGFTQCAQIASQVKEEVDKFKPRVPLISALRNPGMKDRHWNELSNLISKHLSCCVDV